MPAFQASANTFGMVAPAPGDKVNLFNAETLTSPANSIPIAVSPGPYGRRLVTFQIDGTQIVADSSGVAFYQASLTSATTLHIYGSNQYPTAAGFTNGVDIAGSPYTVSSGVAHTVTASVS